MTKLSVNVNKVATLRNTRDIGIPSPCRAARICIDAGVHGITVHPRPDERHIRTSDVYEIHEMLKFHPKVEFNIEGNPFHNMMELCERFRPTQATLVPDAVDTFTSDHGFDVKADGERLRPVIAQLKRWGCRVSLFMDPDPESMAAAAALGADRVELYTEPYAASFTEQADPTQLAAYTQTAIAATAAGLGINAGHDLNLLNLGQFLDAVPRVDEVSIGHALIADALEYGLADTVRRYLVICAARV